MCAEPSVPRQGDGGEEGEESTGSTDGTLGWALQRALRSDLNRGWVWGWEPRNVRANGAWGMGSQVVCLDYRGVPTEHTHKMHSFPISVVAH